MKKWALYIVLVLALCACNKKKHVEPNGYVWYEIKSDGLIGAEDAQGNMLLPCEFGALSLDTFVIFQSSHQFMPAKNFFWRWNVADAFSKDTNLCIRTWQINGFDTVKNSIVTYWEDTMIMSSKNEKNIEKQYRSIVKDENFQTIYEFYAGPSSAVCCLFNSDHSILKNAPELNKRVLFEGYNFYPSYYSFLFNDKGKMIIPLERKYTGFVAYHIENRCFFVVSTGKWDDPYAILSSNGEELFRIDPRTLYVLSRDHYEYNDYVSTYKDRIGIEIASYLSLFYDENKGFGVFQKPIKNPYERDGEIIDNTLYLHWELDARNFEKKREMENSPQILWTGIKIPEYSSTFDVEPSGNNKVGALIDLYAVATQKPSAKSTGQIAGNGPLYEGIYSGSGQIYGLYDPIGISTPSPTPGEPKSQKRWHNVTREEDCTHCLHGECSNCNGTGYVKNPFTGKWMDCPNCDYRHACRYCNGKGTITKTEMVYD